MIEIVVGDEILDLYPNTKIQLVWENGILAGESAAIPHSMPIKFPGSPKNKRIFEHRHHFQVDSGQQVYPCALLVNKTPTPFRQLVIDGYAGEFAGHLSAQDFRADFFALKIKELPGWPTVSISPATSAGVAAYATGNYNDIAFPEIYAPNLYGGKNTAWEKKLNTNDAAKYNTTATGNKYAYAPMLRVHEAVKRMFAGEGWRVDGPFMDDAQLHKLLVWNGKPLDQESKVTHKAVVDAYAKNAFGTLSAMFITRERQDDTGKLDSTGWYNITDVGEYTFKIEGMIAKYASAHSYVYRGQFILKDDTGVTVAATEPTNITHGKTAFISLDESVEFDAAAVAAGRKVMWWYRLEQRHVDTDGWLPSGGCYYSAQMSFEYTEHEYGINVFKKSFSYGDLLPDVTTGAFMGGLKSVFNLLYDWDFANRKLGLYFIEDLVNNYAHDDWSGQMIGEPSKSFPVVRGVRFEWRDSALAGDYKEVGGRHVVIRPACNVMVRGTGNHDTQYINEEGYSEMYGLTREPDFKLLWDYNDEQSPLSLQWRDIPQNYLGDSLWRRYWKNSVELMRGLEALQWKKRMTLPELWGMDMKTKKMVDGKIFLINRMKAVIDHTGSLAPVELELAKVQYDGYIEDPQWWRYAW
jgi:hypothetical protein